MLNSFRTNGPARFRHFDTASMDAELTRSACMPESLRQQWASDASDPQGHPEVQAGRPRWQRQSGNLSDRLNIDYLVNPSERLEDVHHHLGAGSDLQRQSARSDSRVAAGQDFFSGPWLLAQPLEAIGKCSHIEGPLRFRLSDPESLVQFAAVDALDSARDTKHEHVAGAVRNGAHTALRTALVLQNR